MNYISKTERWFQVEIHTRDVNGKRMIHTIPDVSLVCDYVKELDDARTPDNPRDEEEIMMVCVDEKCIYSQLGNDPITWDDITGFFA